MENEYDYIKKLRNGEEILCPKCKKHKIKLISNSCFCDCGFQVNMDPNIINIE